MNPALTTAHARAAPGALASTLINLVYVSTATQVMKDGELLGLLRVARKNNTRRGITGLLLYMGGNFMQVIEGPADVARGLRDRIARDPRHQSMLTLLDKPIAERQFAEWTMGFQNVDRLTIGAFDGVSRFLSDPFTADAYRGKPAQALKLLLSFRDCMR